MQVDTPPVTVVETREQRRERRKKERSEQVFACHSSPFFSFGKYRFYELLEEAL